MQNIHGLNESSRAARPRTAPSTFRQGGRAAVSDDGAASTPAPGNGTKRGQESWPKIPRVCVCGPNLYHLPLAARAVTEVCPELAPRIPADAPRPGGLAAAVPELSALRLLTSSHHGCRLGQPFGGSGQPVVDLDHTLAQHPLLLFNEGVFPFSERLFRHFDHVIFLYRDLCDLFAANTLTYFHLLDRDAGREKRDSFLRAHADTAAQFWNFQTQGFLHLKQRLPVHIMDFDALVADRTGELRRLAAFLGRPAPAGPSQAGLLDNTMLPREFPEPGLGERILPSDVRTKLKRACDSGAKAPSPDFSLPWEFRNTLNILQGRPCAEHVVVHIPARSGSTRLPGKNVADLGGKPLMAWTILLARRVPGVHRVIVNTDDPEYAAIARAYGAETPFLRPKDISGADANLGDATGYLANYLLHQEQYDIAKLVTLYPTSPFRTVAEVARLIGLLDRYPLVQSCIPSRPDWSTLYLDGANQPLSAALLTHPARRYTFKYTGSFSGRSFVTEGQGLLLAPHRTPVECVDIDVQEDLDLARLILSSGLHDFGEKLC